MSDLHLDSEQHAAVASESTRIRVLAGAGSGKTRVLVSRVQALLERGVNPGAICVVTFTRRAGEELVRRLGEDRCRVGTLHSLGYFILRSEWPGRTIADDGVRKRLVRRAMAAVKTELKFGEALGLLCKAKRLDEPFSKKIVDVGVAYERLLAEAKLWDFDDLINMPLRLLEKHEEKRERWQGVWTHVLVDEAQDTDLRQWRLLAQLAQPTTEMFLVGDVNQSLYKFRGAVANAMLSEVDEWLGPFSDYTIGTNYRCRPKVLDLANRVIHGKPGAVRLTPARTEFPFGVQFCSAGSERDEAERIVDAVNEAHACGIGYGDCAVLLRTNSQAEPFEGAFVRHGIPYVIIGSLSFYGRAEIRDILAYLRCSQGWDPEGLDRIFNKPTRYLGEAWHKELMAFGGWPAFAEAQGDLPFTKRYMNIRGRELYHAIHQLMAMATAGATVAALCRYVVNDLKYREWLTSEGEPNDVDEIRSENLDSLIRAAEDWKSVQEFLAYTEMCNQRGRGQTLDRVQISTVHRAKGLEWSFVALAGITEGKLPHKLGDAEEERRIFYVGITRARERLILSHYGEPSVFWAEARRYLGLEGDYVEPAVATGGEDRPGYRRNHHDADDASRGRRRITQPHAGTSGTDHPKRQDGRHVRRDLLGVSGDLATADH